MTAASECLKLAVKDKMEFGSPCFILTEHQMNHTLAELEHADERIKHLEAKIDDYPIEVVENLPVLL